MQKDEEARERAEEDATDGWRSKTPWGKRPQDSPAEGATPATKSKTPEPPDQLLAPKAQQSPAHAPPKEKSAPPPKARPQRRPSSRAPEAASSGAATAGPRAAPPTPKQLPNDVVQPPTRLQVRADMDVDTFGPEEQGRQARVQAERARVQAERPRPLGQPASRGSGTRAATASFSREDTARRKNQEGRANKTEAFGAARTAAFRLGKDPTVYKNIAKLPAEQAASIMLTRPTRLPPLVLESPHEAAQPFHEDWTRVPDKGQELKLRDVRNVMIAEAFQQGRPVFYPSSGDSMWPLVQSGDFCHLHPLQAVTADAGPDPFEKEASEVHVGDVVFCLVQPWHQYYCHIVIATEFDHYRKTWKWFIGGMKRNCNGYCFRENILGIVVDVAVQYRGQYHSRPLPQTLYAQVLPLFQNEKWKEAANLCEPKWKEPLFPEASGAADSLTPLQTA